MKRDAGPPCGNNPNFRMSPGDRAVVEPEPIRDGDPFGPWEYVEIWDQCPGHGDECMFNRCTGRESTCRCCCPVCVGDDVDTWGCDSEYP